MILQAFLIPFWLAGAFMLYSVTSSFLGGARSASFANVVGEVIEAEVETIPDSEGGADTYAPKLRYRYIVAGRTYEADRVMSGDASLTDDEARTWKTTYAVGTRVRVYYDAHAPENATLVRGVAGGAYTMALFAAMWFVFLFAFSAFPYIGSLGANVGAIEVVPPRAID